jgi:hypothetical protein
MDVEVIKAQVRDGHFAVSAHADQEAAEWRHIERRFQAIYEEHAEPESEVVVPVEVYMGMN